MWGGVGLSELWAVLRLVVGGRRFGVNGSDGTAPEPGSWSTLLHDALQKALRTQIEKF